MLEPEAARAIMEGGCTDGDECDDIPDLVLVGNESDEDSDSDEVLM